MPNDIQKLNDNAEKGEAPFLDWTPYWFRRWFVYPIQRIKRGWSDQDVWSLHDYLEEVLIGSLRHLAKYNNGHPMSMTEESWPKFLNETADIIEKASKERGMKQRFVGNEEKIASLHKLVNYWDNLWD